ncbi:hypothetical protein CONPUDRAFT_102897 [Coniophora puteana RWD-64-598 SS2]|uniref:Uncharacterized protein n=1 Tax=Coniophora puteana (strain RWD-64-598) TaxID=741705 RepID=A0A5M3MU52_CONPW|nr:uncharacterized protein CONPUDRAFT_102897 [Coniophora puteana RWD-64-598 SS2]EIW82111.1 hypothetical protein CONPUDRAFT_102897 [Coniophora puteana RWD-64-598 SS2]
MLVHGLARRSTRRLWPTGGPHSSVTVQTPVCRRTFLSMATMTEGFLDLAIALPYPAGWPAYSSTIILLTVLSRLAITVPFSVWAKKRQWRAEDEVIPRVKELAPEVSRLVLKDMKEGRVKGTQQELQAMHGKRVQHILNTRRDELLKEYNCRPGVTMAIAPLTQLPLFMGCSILLTRLSQHPTPFDSESFLTLSTLTHADPTATLPIVLGFLTLANVESSRWLMTDAQREREVKVQQWKEAKVAKGDTVLEPQKIIKSSLRILSVGRIVVATMVPGSVVLYWITSAAFGLVQTWALDFWEIRRRRTKALPSPSPPQGPPSPQRKPNKSDKIPAR